MKKKFNLKSVLGLAVAFCVTAASVPAAMLFTAADGDSAADAAAIYEPSADIEIVEAASGITIPDIDVDGDGRLDYVSLGASNVNGYGLQGYLPAGTTAADKLTANVYGYRQCPEGSYPDLVRDYFEEQGMAVDMHQLAISSMRAEELRYLLDDSYTGDMYTEWRFTGGASWFIQATGSIESTKADYRTSIENADIITLDIGVNNFGVYLSNAITSPEWMGHDHAYLEPEYAAYYAQVMEWLVSKIPEIGEYKDILDTVAYAYIGFISSFDISLEKIRELNPDAAIVVVPIQCIIPDLKLAMDGRSLDLGYIVSELTNAANIYTAHLSPYHNEYFYASSIREDGQSRVEFYIDNIKDYNGDFAVFGDESANILDCFMVYDDTIQLPTALQGLLAGELGVDVSLLKTVVESDRAVIEAAYPEYLAAYDGYYRALDAALDAYAQICAIGAGYYNINPFEFDDAANAVVKAMGDTLVSAAVSGFSGNGRITVPENYAEFIAANYGITEAAAQTVLSFGVRSDIGNSFFGHPNRNGHREIADAVIYAIENEASGIGFAADYAGGLAEKLIAIYRLADSLGYVDMAKEEAAKAIKDYFDDLKADTLTAIDGIADGAIKYLGEKKDDITACVDKAKDIIDAIAGKIDALTGRNEE